MHLDMGVSSRVKWSVVLPDRKITRMGSIIHPTFLEYLNFQENPISSSSAVTSLSMDRQNCFIAAIQRCK
jgi:hypothetical protein